MRISRCNGEAEAEPKGMKVGDTSHVYKEVMYMAQIEHIQAEIEAFSEEDFVRLRKWFADRNWQRWDEQLEADVAGGKLDVLLEEAKAAKAQGNLQDL